MNSSSNITVGLLQFAPILGNIEATIQKIERLLQQGPQAHLWVLPELASSGYNFPSRKEALASSEDLNQSIFTDFLISKAKALNTLFVAGINEREGDRLYNSSVFISANGIMGVYRKLHLFNRENLFFEPGNKGLPVFDTPYGKIGMLICYDWMFPEVWRIVSLKGAQIICHPSNLVLPFCQTAIPGYALSNHIFVATANRVGKEFDFQFTGQSVLVSPKGEYLIRGHRKNEALLTYEIDLTEALDKQLTPFNETFKDRREDVYTLNICNQNEKLRKEKTQLRKKIKELKQQHTKDELKALSRNAMMQIENLEQFKNAKTIFIYWSLPDEVTTQEFIEKWKDSKRFLLPRVNRDHLDLHEYTGVNLLEPKAPFGIMEPTGPCFNNFESIDLAITPGMAFSTNGARLGRGGGFYDRIFKLMKNAYKVGVAFPFQVVTNIPIEQHDIPLDAIIS